MRAGRSLLIILIVIIFACSLLFIFSTPLLKKLANGLVVSDKIQNSDAVLVLGGSSPARVLEAIDIHNDGQADKILITRGGSPEGADFLRSRKITFPEEADLNIFVAGEMGLDKNDLLILPGRVYSTKEEAELLKGFAVENGYEKVIVATSKSHSRRAGIIFGNVFKNSGIKIIIRPSKYDSFDPDNLSKNENHWKSVVLEYEKLFYYYISEIF